MLLSVRDYGIISRRRCRERFKSGFLFTHFVKYIEYINKIHVKIIHELVLVVFILTPFSLLMRDNIVKVLIRAGGGLLFSEKSRFSAKTFPLFFLHSLKGLSVQIAIQLTVIPRSLFERETLMAGNTSQLNQGQASFAFCWLRMFRFDVDVCKSNRKWGGLRVLIVVQLW